MFSLPLSIREVKATEQRLQRIYDAARLGLKGDTLALSAGMLPAEYRQLCQLDPMAELAAQKGRADAEMEVSRRLHEASAAGDAKASLAILQHVHGWTAKQTVTVEDQQMPPQERLEMLASRLTGLLRRAPAQDVIEVHAINR